MSNCVHSYYQSEKHNGKWLCQHCGDVIESWQRLNLLLIERDELRASNTALLEAINPRIIVQEMADIDFVNGDSLCLKLGGDGDNGEYLIELMEAALAKELEKGK
jgi:hypothetical protein